jgi:hypothetical protein
VLLIGWWLFWTTESAETAEKFKKNLAFSAVNRSATLYGEATRFQEEGKW